MARSTFYIQYTESLSVLCLNSAVNKIPIDILGCIWLIQFPSANKSLDFQYCSKRIWIDLSNEKIPIIFSDDQMNCFNLSIYTSAWKLKSSVGLLIYLCQIGFMLHDRIYPPPSHFSSAVAIRRAMESYLRSSGFECYVCIASKVSTRDDSSKDWTPFYTPTWLVYPPSSTRRRTQKLNNRK